MTKPFQERRRQNFLYEQLYLGSRKKQLSAIANSRRDVASLRNEATPNHLYIEGTQAFVYHEKFWLWMLDYTAGVPLDDLAPRLKEVVDEFVVWHEVAVALYRELQANSAKNLDADNASPVHFSEQTWYGDVLQLVSVALMLRDSLSVRRILHAMRSNLGRDALFDELVADYAEGQPKTTHLEHEEYQPLLAVFNELDDAKAVALVKSYCKAWYKAQDGARWYDGHLKVYQDAAPYYGYWAFEAGAACYLLDIDDSSIDHMVYPKDLVAYGRQLRAEGRWTTDDDTPIAATTRSLRALHGEAVPEGGTWFTPAIKGPQGRVHLQAGERLPETTYTDWGEVVWYLER